MADERERYLVAAMLEPVETGQQFDYLPAHMTIVRWFYFANHRYHFLQHSLEGLSNPQYFTGISGGERAQFGPNHDVPVTRLKGVNSIPNYGLHHLIEAMGEYKDDDFKEYNPHISDAPEKVVLPGEAVTFSTVALVSKFGKRGINTIKWSKQLSGNTEATEGAPPLTPEDQYHA